MSIIASHADGTGTGASLVVRAKYDNSLMDGCETAALGIAGLPATDKTNFDSLINYEPTEGSKMLDAALSSKTTRRLAIINVTYDNGALSVTITDRDKPDATDPRGTFSGTLPTGADFSTGVAVSGTLSVTKPSSYTDIHMGNITLTYSGESNPAASTETKTNLLDATNADKWTTAWGFESDGGPFIGVANLAKNAANWNYTEEDDIQAFLGASTVNGGSTRDGNQYGAFTYGEDINLGDNFSVLTTMYMRTVLWSDKTQAVDDSVSLTLGKYTLRMIHSAADISGETTSNRSNFRAVLLKDGVELGRSAVIAQTVKAKFGDNNLVERYGTDLSKTGPAGVLMSSTFATKTDKKASARDIANGANDAIGAKDFTIVVKDGKLSVKDSNGDIIKFNNGTTDLTEFEVTAGEFDGIKPVVKTEGDSVLRKGTPILMLRLIATLNPAASTSSQATSSTTSTTSTTSTASTASTTSTTSTTSTSSQSTSSTAAPTGEPIDMLKNNLLSVANITKWTRTTTAEDASGKAYFHLSAPVDMRQYSGWAEKAAKDDIQGILALHAFVSLDVPALWVDFTYSETLNLGNEFTLLMTPYSRATLNRNGNVANGDSSVALKLGKYTIAFTRVKDDVKAEDVNNHTKYRLILFKDGTEVARTAILDESTVATFAGQRLNVRYPDLVSKDEKDKPGAADYIRLHTPGVGSGAPAGGLRPFMLNVNDNNGATDALGARDFYVVVKDGKMSFKTAAGATIAFEGNKTSFDVATGDFDAVQPVVTITGDLLTKENPMAMLRLALDYAGAPVSADPVAGSQATSSNTGSQSTSSQSTASGTIPTLEPRTVTTVETKGMDKASCELPEEIPWNSRGSGLIKTTQTGDALLVCGQNAACDLTAEIGTYAIDSYFKLNFTLYGKNATPKETSGVNGDNESWIVTVGDFQFTFTRAAYATNIDNTAHQHTVVLKKVTYKGSELPIVGDTVYTNVQAFEHAHNSTETLTANAEYRAYCDNEFIDYSWMLKEGQYFWPTFHHNMEIVYDRGVITITNLGNPDKINIGGGPVVAQVDATKVVDTTKELGASRVALTAKGTETRGTYVTIIGNYSGVYEAGTADVSGSGSGNSGSGAVKTGDARSITLALAILMACVSAAGLILINRKRIA